VYDALSYYYDHRARIDAEILQLGDVNQAARVYPPTLQPRNDGDQDLS
jgi:hypothetical protein